jgi:serum/glucocorticoid-regulated kinase 2
VQTDANAQSDVPNGALQRDKTKKRKKKKVPHARKSSRKVAIDDFEMMRVLGKGCAGKVLLVRHKASSELYALKAITKKHVLAHQELQHTLTEQAVLKRMAHEVTDPFVVRLWWSFHDRENLFLVMVSFYNLFLSPLYILGLVKTRTVGWMTELRRTGLPPWRRPRYPARAMGPPRA